MSTYNLEGGFYQRNTEVKENLNYPSDIASIEENDSHIVKQKKILELNLFLKDLLINIQKFPENKKLIRELEKQLPKIEKSYDNCFTIKSEFKRKLLGKITKAKNLLKNRLN